MTRLLPSCLLAAALSLAFSAAAVASGEVYRWTDEKGVRHYSDSPPAGRAHTTFKVATQRPKGDAAAPETVVAEAPAPRATTNQSNCEIARKNLETFANSEVVTMDRDGDGQPESLDAAGRAAEIARNEELVRIYCQP